MSVLSKQRLIRNITVSYKNKDWVGKITYWVSYENKYLVKQKPNNIREWVFHYEYNDTNESVIKQR